MNLNLPVIVGMGACLNGMAQALNVGFPMTIALLPLLGKPRCLRVNYARESIDRLLLIHSMLRGTSHLCLWLAAPPIIVFLGFCLFDRLVVLGIDVARVEGASAERVLVTPPDLIVHCKIWCVDQLLSVL